jgi:hypothetical protein
MSIHRRYYLGADYFVADPELDSDFFEADFSAAGFAGALVGVEEVDGVVEVDGVDPESDFGDLVAAELSDARESVR